jgi:hypothetical protein
MRVGWFQRLTRWGVVTLGLALALWGLGAMWEGWDKIQIERGWSLFIAGAVAIAGGVVTLALAAVLSRLDRAIAVGQAAVAASATPAEPARSSAKGEPAAAPRPEAASAADGRAASQEPIEVDRHVEGDTVYVIFSDGSVEMRSPRGAQRFASLAELKSRVGEQS